VELQKRGVTRNIDLHVNGGRLAIFRPKEGRGSILAPYKGLFSLPPLPPPAINNEKSLINSTKHLHWVHVY